MADQVGVESFDEGQPVRPEQLDYRFTLANERTFLAWIRSSLALIAAGVAVVHYVPGPEALRLALGLLLVVLGGLLALQSFRTWSGNQAAMEAGRPLPSSVVPRVVAVALAVAALGSVVLVLLDGLGG